MRMPLPAGVLNVCRQHQVGHRHGLTEHDPDQIDSYYVNLLCLPCNAHPSLNSCACGCWRFFVWRWAWRWHLPFCSRNACTSFAPEPARAPQRGSCRQPTAQTRPMPRMPRACSIAPCAWPHMPLAAMHPRSPLARQPPRARRNTSHKPLRHAPSFCGRPRGHLPVFQLSPS